jgi:hypothetical protein
MFIDDFLKSFTQKKEFIDICRRLSDAYRYETILDGVWRVCCIVSQRLLKRNDSSNFQKNDNNKAASHSRFNYHVQCNFINRQRLSIIGSWFNDWLGALAIVCSNGKKWHSSWTTVVVLLGCASIVNTTLNRLVAWNCAIWLTI